MSEQHQPTPPPSPPEAHLFPAPSHTPPPPPPAQITPADDKRFNIIAWTVFLLLVAAGFVGCQVLEDRAAERPEERLEQHYECIEDRATVMGLDTDDPDDRADPRHSRIVSDCMMEHLAN